SMANQYYIQELLNGKTTTYSYGCGNVEKAKQSFANSFIELRPDEMGRTHSISKKAFCLATWRHYPQKEAEVKKILAYSLGGKVQVGFFENIIVSILCWLRK
ncbi:hypothetical protein, partial [Aurantivibrio plasticivorans]